MCFRNSELRKSLKKLLKNGRILDQVKRFYILADCRGERSVPYIASPKLKKKVKKKSQNSRPPEFLNP